MSSPAVKDTAPRNISADEIQMNTTSTNKMTKSDAWIDFTSMELRQLHASQQEAMKKINEFSGESDESDIDEWLYDLTNLFSLMKLQDETKVLMAMGKLTGSALRWYQENLTLFDGWKEAEDALHNRFQTSASIGQLIQEFFQLRQEEEQSVTSFYDTVMRKYRQIGKSITENQIITVLQAGVKRSLKEHLFRNEVNMSRPDEWLIWARDEERVQRRIQQRITPPRAETRTPYFEPTLSTAAIQQKPSANPPSDNHTRRPYHRYQNRTYMGGNTRAYQYDSRNQNDNQHQRQQTNSTQVARKPRPCLVCNRTNHSTMECFHKKKDGWGSDDGDDPRGEHKSSITSSLTTSTTTYNPIFVKVLCNNTPQEALIDTGSAITIIHKRLLSKIPYTQFTSKTTNHLSASCSAVNIIGEVLLSININGLITNIKADVATDLVTNLILGSDWIQANNVYILTPEKRIMIKHRTREVSTSFIKPPLLNYPATLASYITLSPFSEHIIEVQLQRTNMDDALFEPNPRLQRKALFTACALLGITEGKATISIINATNRRQTLSEGTRIGTVTQMAQSVNLIMPSSSAKTRIPNGKACKQLIPKGKVANDTNLPASTVEENDTKCRNCSQRFATRNDLFQHLRERCYPDEIRQQIQELTIHIPNDEQRNQISNILWKYGNLFDLRKPSKINIVLQNAIDTGTHKPLHTPPYRKSNRDQEMLREETQKLLKNDIIEHSTSPWSSPVILVQKKDGTTRFCVDYRRLNQITTKDAFPLPRMDDIYDQLTKATYFSKFDFKSGYFQIPLDEADRPKTAFSTRDGHFQFKVLPQGLTNGPPTFQRIVNQILGPNRWKHMLAYIDDIIIYSRTFPEHAKHIEE
ncbi:unnamed protein product, partial [Adineta ricciae]